MTDREREVPFKIRDLLKHSLPDEQTEHWWNTRNVLLNKERPRDMWWSTAWDRPTAREMVIDAAEALVDGDPL